MIQLLALIILPQNKFYLPAAKLKMLREMLLIIFIKIEFDLFKNKLSLKY